MNKRVKLIDGMRGFSLIGILMANMLIFQYGMWGKDELQHFQLFSGDSISNTWLRIFVESSFMPIFMFLFGYSMIKFKEKLERDGKKVKRHFVRRSFLLLVLGLLHSIYIWEGDILFTYGFLSLIMLIFINRNKKTMLVWASVLFILTSLLGLGTMEPTKEEAQNMTSYVEKATEIYAAGSYTDIKEFRNSDEDPLGLPPAAYFLLFLLSPFILCPIFLLGMYAAKSNWFANPQQERRGYLLVSMVLVPLGLLLKSLSYAFPDASFSGVAGMLGAPLLSLGYIFAFALLYTMDFNPLLALFEKVGRLSLSNYLLQSVICTTIFYGYGFGLFGKIGVLNGILLAIVIYSTQVALSHWYLQYRKAGPVETLMRIGTYWQWKKKKQQAVTHGVVMK
ncbi:uncharacterized protein JOC95_001801 [Bacillus tianshenii]|uniref:DUF418 domain-containing protein n=1 Tax=Sutcliffiella tianshenii TaxID=1463404 RepID=A0ABS2NZ27_9BACI|nr:DUF418 domain-containing protein [Bacillus tianshenii]MBM7619949.1 uncharacterized protein [Bacillus tianshenii]